MVNRNWLILELFHGGISQLYSNRVATWPSNKFVFPAPGKN